MQAAADAWAERQRQRPSRWSPHPTSTSSSARASRATTPPDLFYMGWDQFATYASNGYLEPYAADLPNAGDFYPALVDTFTYDGTFYCAPKDFSTLGLIINTDLWAAAGLTDADIPTDWDEPRGRGDEAHRPTTTVGLVVRPGVRAHRRLHEPGRRHRSSTATPSRPTAPRTSRDSSTCRSCTTRACCKWPAEIDAGWGGEAFGTGKAAMVIEGPWIKGIAGRLPRHQLPAYELPAGPGGQSTFTFTNCWGIPAGLRHHGCRGVDSSSTSPRDDQQLAFADAFGVIPSTESAPRPTPRSTRRTRRSSRATTTR